MTEQIINPKLLSLSNFMLHNREDLESLEPFLLSHRSDYIPHFDLFNMWASEGRDVHEADTVMFYLSMLPIIERRLSQR